MKVKKRSQKQEKKVAKSFNAKTVVASGALWGSKGDVRSEKYLIECKYTEHPQYRLTKNVWDKIKKEAIKDGLRIPLMSIEVAGRSLIVLERKDCPDEVGELNFGVCILPCSVSFLVRKDFQEKTFVSTGFGEFVILDQEEYMNLFKE